MSGETAHNGQMARKRLDERLECPICHVIRLSIPDDPKPNSPVHCSNCGSFLGTWSEMQESFFQQAKGSRLFDLKRGTIVRR